MKVSLGSMLQLCNVAVLPIVYTECWVSQVCITDLIHTHNSIPDTKFRIICVREAARKADSLC